MNQGVCFNRGSSLTSLLAAKLVAPRPPRLCSPHRATKPRGVHVFASSSSPLPPFAPRCEPLSRARATAPPQPWPPRQPAASRQPEQPEFYHPSLQNVGSTRAQCRRNVSPLLACLPDAFAPVAPARGTHPSSVITRGTASRRFAAAACERNCATAAAHPRHRLAAVVHAAETKRAAWQGAGIKAGSSHPVEDGGTPWKACVKEALK